MKSAFLRRFLLIVSIALLTFLGFLWVAGSALYAYNDSWSLETAVSELKSPVHVPPDAIVCLAGGKGRLWAAGELWAKYGALVPERRPKLLISGLGKGTQFKSIVRQFSPYAQSVVRPEDLLFESESANTEANAIWLARTAEAQGWHKIVLMTSPYHLRRSLWIVQEVLRSMGYRLEILTASAPTESFDPKTWWRTPLGVLVTSEEFLKFLYFRFFWLPPAASVLRQ